MKKIYYGVAASLLTLVLAVALVSNFHGDANIFAGEKITSVQIENYLEEKIVTFNSRAKIEVKLDQCELTIKRIVHRQNCKGDEKTFKSHMVDLREVDVDRPTIIILEKVPDEGIILHFTPETSQKIKSGKLVNSYQSFTTCDRVSTKLPKTLIFDLKKGAAKKFSELLSNYSYQQECRN